MAARTPLAFLLPALLSHGDPGAVGALVEHGAEVNAPEGDGRTALHLAVVAKNGQIALYLLDHGADLYRKDHYGMNPLDSAALRIRSGIFRILSGRQAEQEAAR